MIAGGGELDQLVPPGRPVPIRPAIEAAYRNARSGSASAQRLHRPCPTFRRCSPQRTQVIVLGGLRGAAARDAGRARPRRLQVPQLPAPRAGPFGRGPVDAALASMASVPVAELDRSRAVHAGRIVGHSGGIERPRAALGSGLVLAGRASAANGGGVYLEQVVGRALQRGAQRDECPASPGQGAW